jgi:DNA polymerase-3 subunit delta'
MQFKNIIGQELIKKRLINSVLSNKISHAQLFFGSEGVGKLALAIAYAQYINCTNRTETDSCGECNSCKKYNKLIHPDLHFVFPVVKIKPDSVSDDHIQKWRDFVNESPYFTYNQWVGQLDNENKQAGIFVQESKNILKKINLTSYESEYKVMIFWLAEKMNTETANKLLKIIEEPPKKTLFILISEAPDSIITTIKSRTQPVNIPKIENFALKLYLQENTEFAENEYDTAIKYSNGSLTSLLKFIDDSEENNELFDLFVKFMRVCYKYNIDEINELTKEFTSLTREKQKRFFLLSVRLVRENLILNLGLPEISILTTAEYNFSSKFSNFIKFEIIEDLENELSKAFLDLERNGSAKIIFYDVAIKVNKLLRKAK